VTVLLRNETSVSRWPLVGLLVLALAVRLGWAWIQPTDPDALRRLPDQQEYLQLGENLVDHGRLSFADERFHQEVYAFRMPAYPLLIAVCRADLRAVRLTQAVLDASCVLAAYLIARRWLSHRRSLFAAAIVAINPFLIYFSGLILSETLFTAMLAWGMVLLVARGRARLLPSRAPHHAQAARQEPRYPGIVWRLWAGRILLVLSIFVRPSALALPLILGIGEIFLNRREREAAHSRWSLPVGATMVLLTLAALIPWAARNHAILGEWIFTTTNSGFTAYDGLNPDASGASDQTFIEAMPQLRKMTEVQRSQYLSQEAKAFAIAHPKRVLQLAVIKVARFWTPIPLSSEYRQMRYVLIGALYSIPLDVLVVVGLLSGSLPRAAKVMLMLPAVYFTIAHALTIGSLRYRIPVEVPMAIVAASAVIRARARAPDQVAMVDVDADGQ
jgi:4-amino-4-deoxy-L-arabinose transferase-like glycosyltransferase